MKSSGNKKALGIWLLMAVFAFPFAFEPFHIHHEKRLTELTEQTSEDCEHTHTHTCETCPLCHFFLTGFTLPEHTELVTVTLGVVSRQVYYLETGYATFIHSFFPEVLQPAEKHFTFWQIRSTKPN